MLLQHLYNYQVGLAVGDTQEERAKAQLTKISLQVVDTSVIINDRDNVAAGQTYFRVREHLVCVTLLCCNS